MDYSELVARLDELGKAGKAAGIVTIWDQAAAAIRDLLAEREWRPIESAPRDGTEILCWPGLRKPETAVTGAWLDTRGGPCWVELGVGHHNGYWRPTHWLPLPKGPAS